MLLREAVVLASAARVSSSRVVALVCSFEPLLLTTYLQAHLAQAVVEDVPRVVGFGYDQLQAALARTETELRAAPAVLCLSWEDLHPALSWRSRAPLSGLTEPALEQGAAALGGRLREWMRRRAGADTVMVLPPMEWLPLHDSAPASAWGPLALAAAAAMHEMARALASQGAKVLRACARELNYRELWQSGCPLAADDADALARQAVEALVRPGGRKKAVVVDLDGTLWSGVIGEDGPQGIACAPEGKGAPYHAFQKFLAKLKSEGVWLAFCSKNTPSDVLPVFDRLAFPLTLRDFAAYRCDWDPKPAHVQAIAEALNIRVEDLVVVDDNPAELAALRARWPALTAVETPRDGAAWGRLFRTLQELCGTWQVREEDRLRVSRPIEPRVAAPAASPDPWAHLKELELAVTVNPEAAEDPRSLELINKTNQFTLTGERVSAEEWLQSSRAPGAWCVSARLRDRFGDFGTIAVLAGSREDGALRVRHGVMSCRAFGRGVEWVCLGALAELGPWEQLIGPVRSTEKNEPALRFLAELGWAAEQGGDWRASRAAVLAKAARVREAAGITVRVRAGAPVTAA